MTTRLSQAPTPPVDPDAKALLLHVEKTAFLLQVEAVIARHPTWAPDVSAAMNEGIARALRLERERQAVLERGFQALFGNRKVLKGAASRRRFVEEAVEALAALGGTEFQRRARAAVMAGKQVAGEVDE